MKEKAEEARHELEMNQRPTNQAQEGTVAGTPHTDAATAQHGQDPVSTVTLPASDTRIDTAAALSVREQDIPETVIDSPTTLTAITPVTRTGTRSEQQSEVRRLTRASRQDTEQRVGG
jgi:hypothetical protein